MVALFVIEIFVLNQFLPRLADGRAGFCVHVCLSPAEQIRIIPSISSEPLNMGRANHAGCRSGLVASFTPSDEETDCMTARVLTICSLVFTLFRIRQSSRYARLQLFGKHGLKNPTLGYVYEQRLPIIFPIKTMTVNHNNYMEKRLKK